MASFRLTHVLLLIASLPLVSTSLFACSCAYIGPACHAAWSQGVDAILLGQVEKIEASSLPGMNKVTVAAEEVYRGTAAKSIDVYTASASESCGYSFLKGERYVIFAWSSGGRLMVSLCSATRPAKYAEEDIAYLRSIPSLNETARLYGTFKRYTYDPNFKPSFQPSVMDHYRPPEEEYRAMAPMAGSRIRVKNQDGIHQTKADEKGNWAIDGLRAGPYEISVDLPKNLVLDPAWGIRGELVPKGCSRVYLRTESNGHLAGHIVSARPLSENTSNVVALFHAEEPELDISRPPFEVYPDSASGAFDLGPVPAGKYYLVAILTDHNYDRAAVFYPGVENPKMATAVELGDGEKRSELDFSIGNPNFHLRQTCCEFKILLRTR
jgi:hypothetical protein